MNPRGDIDIWRMVWYCVILIGSIYAGVKCQPLLLANFETVRIAIMVFSVITGFLMVSITMIADSVLKSGLEYKELVNVRAMVNDRLVRYAFLICSYLVACVLALTVQLTKGLIGNAEKYVQIAFLSWSLFVLLLSFRLPFTVLRVQQERYELTIHTNRPEPLKRALASQDDDLG